MRRAWPVARWAFVVPILWMGFVLAISFLETPLKFRAPSVTLPIGLEIGHLVFHALNRVEVVFAMLVSFSVLSGPRRRGTVGSVLGVTATLLVQTVLLCGPLDARVAAILSGRPVGEAPWHAAYIALEVTKIVLLVGLSARLIADFRRAEIEEEHPYYRNMADRSRGSALHEEMDHGDQ